MAGKTKKGEGPSCACGKGDLYEEFIKNRKTKREILTLRTINQVEDRKNFVDSVKKGIELNPIEKKRFHFLLEYLNKYNTII